MSPLNEKCKICDKGYLVKDYSPSLDKTFLFCNTCFKYKQEKASLKEEETNNWDDEVYGWGGMSNEELNDYFEQLFKDLD